MWPAHCVFAFHFTDDSLLSSTIRVHTFDNISLSLFFFFVTKSTLNAAPTNIFNGFVKWFYLKISECIFLFRSIARYILIVNYYWLDAFILVYGTIYLRWHERHYTKGNVIEVRNSSSCPQFLSDWKFSSQFHRRIYSIDNKM